MRGSGWEGTFFRFPKAKINPYLYLNHPVTHKVRGTAERNNYRGPMAEHDADRRAKAKQNPHTTEQATNPNPMAERNHRQNIGQSW
jgi:hypothetical protein